jgi:hypothetical protein
MHMIQAICHIQYHTISYYAIPYTIYHDIPYTYMGPILIESYTHVCIQYHIFEASDVGQSKEREIRREGEGRGSIGSVNRKNKQTGPKGDNSKKEDVGGTLHGIWHMVCFQRPYTCMHMHMHRYEPNRVKSNEERSRQFKTIGDNPSQMRK